MSASSPGSSVPKVDTPTELTKTSIGASAHRLGVGGVVAGARGSYRITEIFKAGGMGETYLAADSTTGALAVVKVVQARLLKAAKGSAADRIVKRFDREIDILRLLRGLPNVVTMIDSGEIKDVDGGSARFMALEFIEGKELRRYLPDRQPVELRTFLNLGNQLCQGLVAIHERGQSHRDIKPENVMVDTGGGRAPTVKYIDFGLGKPVFGGLEQVTHLNDRIGTNDYVAPELSLRMGDIREDEIRQADVYSLGVLLWRMATGGPPFGPDATPEMRRNPPAPEGGLSGRFTPALRDALRRSVLPRPLDRPTSKQLRDAFAGFAVEALRDAGRASDTPRTPTLAPVPATEMEATELSVHELAEGGTIASRYRIDGKLGKGSMGMVYRATDLKLKRVVAIKVAHDKRAIVTDEAENLARVEHQNIVRVIDIGEEQGSAFIVMEYVGGETLAELLADGAPLTGGILRDLALGIVDGVRFAHGKGVQHNDLGPNNVKWDGEKRTARILDFGIAEGGADGAKKGVKATNLAVLTPDQLLGVEGEASDLYQIGVLLYLMTTGREPYTADSIDEYKRLVLEHLPKPPLEVNPALEPPELSALVMKCLAKKADDRFDSAEALHERLLEVFRPKAKGSKAMAIAAAVLGVALIALLVLRFCRVWPFAEPPTPAAAAAPRELFLTALAEAGPFHAALAAADSGIEGAARLIKTPVGRLTYAVRTEGDGTADATGATPASWWDRNTKDLPAADFGALVSVTRRGPDGVERRLDVVRKPDGLEVDAPAEDGAYEDVLTFLPPEGAKAIDGVAFVRDTLPPSARLTAFDGAAVKPIVQYPNDKDGVVLEGRASDTAGLADLPSFMEEPSAAIWRDVVATADGGIRAVLSPPKNALQIFIRAVDRAGRAAVPAAPAADRILVLPSRTVAKAHAVAGATKRELGAKGTFVELDAAGSGDVLPSLEVEFAAGAFPAGSTPGIRVRGVDGGPDAVVRSDGQGRFTLVSEWKDRRLSCSFFVTLPDGARFDLTDAAADFRFGTARAVVTRSLLRAADRGDAEDLSARALDEAAVLLLAPGDRLVIEAPVGIAAALTDADGKPLIVDDAALKIRKTDRGFELTAGEAGPVAAAGWLREFRLALTSAASDRPDVRSFRAASAPFGASAKVASSALVDANGVVWIGAAWPLLPIEPSGDEAAPFKAAGFELRFSGADRVSAGIQAADAAAGRAAVTAEVRRGAFRYVLPLRVGSGDSAETVFRRDIAAPTATWTWSAKDPADVFVPRDRAGDFTISVTLDDGADGVGVEPRLTQDVPGAKPIAGTPATGSTSRATFVVGAADLRFDVDYVYTDRLGNEGRFRWTEKPEEQKPVGGTEPPPPPVILTRAIVDGRAAAAGIVLLPVPTDGPLFRMMEFELTHRNALRIRRALASGDSAFQGVPEAVKSVLLSQPEPRDSDEPLNVAEPNVARAYADALGVDIPSSADWLTAARGSASGKDNPRRQDGKFFNQRLENGANLRKGGGERAEAAGWFTVTGLHGLKAMAGNMAELVTTASGTAWIGGDWFTPGPVMEPGNVRTRETRGVRFQTKLR